MYTHFVLSVLACKNIIVTLKEWKGTIKILSSTWMKGGGFMVRDKNQRGYAIKVFLFFPLTHLRYYA